MSLGRNNRREIEKHTNNLAALLAEFYEFLSSKNKPSDETVRHVFAIYENKWITYCKKKNLPEKLCAEFNHQVSEAWTHKQEEK